MLFTLEIDTKNAKWPDGTRNLEGWLRSPRMPRLEIIAEVAGIALGHVGIELLRAHETPTERGEPDRPQPDSRVEKALRDYDEGKALDSLERNDNWHPSNDPPKPEDFEPTNTIEILLDGKPYLLDPEYYKFSTKLDYWRKITPPPTAMSHDIEARKPLMDAILELSSYGRARGDLHITKITDDAMAKAKPWKASPRGEPEEA